MSAEEGATASKPESEKPISKSAPPKDSAPADGPSTSKEESTESAKPESSKEKEGSKPPRSQRQAAAAASKGQSASSPVKKTARPGKARTSVPATKSTFTPGKDEKFKIGDIVLARLKGYPPWPARIADPDDLPHAVAASRSSKSSNVYCVQFFPVGDYAWLINKEINSLSPSDIEAFLGQTHRKGAGSLHEAYSTAQDPTEWNGTQAERRAAAEAKAAENQEDELDDEDEEDGEPAGGKKRKAPASKSTSKKTKVSKDKAVKSDKPAPKSKGAAQKAPESKPAPVENQAPADDDPLSQNPECVRVKNWRHQLQRALLGKSLPGADEMTAYDDLYKTIEAYEGMTVDALTYSKIGKVMKKIAHLDNIPRNDELRITDRSQKLMNDWQTIIDKSSKKDTNGDAKAANGDD